MGVFSRLLLRTLKKNAEKGTEAVPSCDVFLWNASLVSVDVPNAGLPPVGKI